MCGIIGALAARPVVPILLAALRRMEYRGYDSAGVATVDGGALAQRRSVGKLAALVERLEHEPLAGRSGIGHTRWATHGEATEENAHPQRAGAVAVVHNGIIENHAELRDQLRAQGCAFESETDTEVVAQLCSEKLRAGLDPEAAVLATLERLQGAFALCFLFEGFDDLLICARRGSPLAIGYGEGEMFVGSDALALAEATRRIAYLEEGDCAVVTRAGARTRDAGGRPVTRPVTTLDAPEALAGKCGFAHYMAKEIHEQPSVLARVVERYLPDRGDPFAEAGLDLASVESVVMVACGSAHYACLAARHWFETLARVPVYVDVASEFRYREPPLGVGGLALFVSQSGETADTLAALRYARACGRRTVALVNVETSTMAREADVTLPILAGPEISVAATKTFTAQVTTLTAMAIATACARGALSAQQARDQAAALRGAPAALTAVLAREEPLAALAVDIAAARDVLYLGRGAMYPLALEGALKLKEVTYIHAEGYAAGELKHGPIALVDAMTPVIVMAAHDALFAKTLSNMQEVAARKGRVALIGDAEAVAEARAVTWRSVAMPTTAPVVAPIVAAAAAQILAYHAAVARDLDIDQPRNLAKSVTVE